MTLMDSLEKRLSADDLRAFLMSTGETRSVEDLKVKGAKMSIAHLDRASKVCRSLNVLTTDGCCR
jgi:hypothetical protein